MATYQYSKELDPSLVQNSPAFTTLPIRISKNTSISQKASAEFIAQWEKAKSGPKAHPAQGPYGHWVSLVFPECPPDMVAIMTRAFDYTFTENDLLDSQNESQDPQIERHTPSLLDPIHRKIRDRLIEDVLQIDHPAATSVLKYGKEYWALKLKKTHNPSTLEEYVQQRIVQSAFVATGKILCLAMGLRIDSRTLQSVEHITRPLDEVNALCNDFYSYEKEKEELQCGRGMNAVQFIMNTEGLSERQALEFVRQKIVSLEEAHNTAFGEAMEKGSLSPELREYLILMRLAAGGSHFWQSTSPRYKSRPYPVDPVQSDMGFLLRHGYQMFPSVMVVVLLFIFKWTG